MKNKKMVLMWTGIAIEIAAIILIAMSIGTDLSPAVGIALLTIGIGVLVIGIATKSKESQAGPN